MVDLAPGVLAVIGAAALLGAVVQSTVGIGLGLVAAPVVTLVAPQLMPGAMLLAVVVLPLLTLAREHEEIDWWGLAWSFPLRVVGTGIGVVLVTVADDRVLELAIGLMVLLAVVLTWRAVEVPVTRTTLGGAGFVSGVMGTTSSIGGPPMALLYQHRPPRQIRTTLAVYFLLGATMSAAGLAVAGQLTAQQVRAAALMVPVLLLGVEVSRRLRHRLHPSRVRPAVLLVCAGSSVALVARALVG